MRKLYAAEKYIKALKSSTAHRRNRCQAIRKQYDIKVSEIARFLEVTVQTVYRWEKEGVPKASIWQNHRGCS